MMAASHAATIPTKGRVRLFIRQMQWNISNAVGISYSRPRAQVQYCFLASGRLRVQKRGQRRAGPVLQPSRVSLHHGVT